MLPIHYPDAEDWEWDISTPRSTSRCTRPSRRLGRELTRRLELDHTPKHGSWLNLAEVELSVLNCECLNRCLSDLETFKSEVAA